MANKEETIQSLQYFVNGLSVLATSHEIHGRIFNSQGFARLGKKYIDHATEEIELVGRFIDRIPDFGGCVKQENVPEYPVIYDIYEFLKKDLEISLKGLEILNKYIDQTVLDHETFNLLKDYFFDEESDKAWTEQQLELIDHLGIKNYLLGQL
jgi:bacterioferritin